MKARGCLVQSRSLDRLHGREGTKLRLEGCLEGRENQDERDVPHGGKACLCKAVRKEPHEQASNSSKEKGPEVWSDCLQVWLSMMPRERTGEENYEERIVHGSPKCVPENISPGNNGHRRR